MLHSEIYYGKRAPNSSQEPIYGNLLESAKNKDKDAINNIAQMTLISKRFNNDTELKDLRKRWILEIIRQDCAPNCIFKIYDLIMNNLGFLPKIGNTSEPYAYAQYSVLLKPNIEEMKYPIAFVKDKATGQRGFVFKVHAKDETKSFSIFSTEIPLKDFSETLIVYQYYSHSHEWTVHNLDRHDKRLMEHLNVYDEESLIDDFYLSEHAFNSHRDKTISFMDSFKRDYILDILLGRDPNFAVTENTSSKEP